MLMAAVPSSSSPRVTRCERTNREWIHAQPLRYYLAETQDKRWSVVDAETDFFVTPAFAKKGLAVSHFVRSQKKKR
jgi:hypothetical protein